jgi:YVTN family beta-propeller protein
MICKTKTKMKTKTNFALSMLAMAVFLGACKKDDPATPEPETPTTYDNGVFITNEGPFGSGTGTVDFYSRSTGTVSHDIFQEKNGYPLGNIVHSIEVYNNKAYIVVNNSGKVEVADASSFASAGVIGGLTLPRFFIGINSNKGYISEYGAGGSVGAVKIVNLSTNTVSGTIMTGKGPEAMVRYAGKVYVACGGGFGNDSVVTVIDESADTVITNIVVGANPKGVVRDASGDIWALCTGQWDATYTYLEKPARLVRISSSTNTVTLTIPFASTTSQPSSLVTSALKTVLYFNYNGQVYAHHISSTTLAPTGSINRNFYSIGVDPVTSYLYCGDAGDFSGNGKVIRYTHTFSLIDSMSAGIIPGNFYFK